MRQEQTVIVLDWNGTLWDDLLLNYGSVTRIFNSFGLPAPTIDEYRSEIGADFMDFYRRHGIPETATPERLNTIRKSYLDEHHNEAKLRDGAAELINSCKLLGAAVGILSAEDHGILWEKLKVLGLTPPHVLLFACGSSFDKTEAFWDVFAFIDGLIDWKNAVYVDDTRDGLIAAKKLAARWYNSTHGQVLNTIGFSGGYHSHQRVMEAAPDFPKHGEKAICSMLQVQTAIQTILTSI